MSRSPRPSAKGLASAAPDAGLALVFLAVWIAPAASLPGTVAYLTLLMVLEFIIIHSSAFMGAVALGDGPPRGRAALLIGLGAFYTLFAGAVSVTGKSWWPLLSFWGLTANRVSGVLLGQSPKGEEKRFLAVGWGVSVLFYMLGAMLTLVLPVPRLGVTPEVVTGLPSSGLWVEQPHRLLAFGFLYFTATAVSEAFDHRWMPAVGERPQSPGKPLDRAETA